MAETLKDRIKRHEGLNTFPYHCPAGALTIGYGHNLEEGISKEAAEFILDEDIEEALRELERFFGEGEEEISIEAMGPERYGVLVEMVFNMGIARFAGFRKMIAALRERDWEKAAEEMLDSRWHEQVPARVERLAIILRKGACGAAMERCDEEADSGE